MLANLPVTELFDVFIAILISMTIHEAMHGYVAHWLGDNTAADSGRLTFNPLKSIDLITTIALPLVLIALGLQPIFAAKPVPFNPSRVKFREYGAALVGLAGPFTNFVLAVIGALILRFYATSASMTVVNALFIFVEVNVAFFVFNLIPFPPLDGSRLLYAFAPEPIQRVMAAIESTNFMIILLFFLIAFHFVAGPISNIEVHILNWLLGPRFSS